MESSTASRAKRSTSSLSPSTLLPRVKAAAQGRWVEILTSLTKITADQLSGKKQPCPKCGGDDRFRAFRDVNQEGGVVCSHCPDRTHDGLATLSWLNGWTFPESLKAVAAYLRLDEQQPQRPAAAPTTKPAKAAKPSSTAPKPTKPVGVNQEKVSTASSAEPTQPAAQPARLEFLSWNPLLAAMWCKARPPIKPEALELIGARFARYSGLVVIAFPIWGERLKAAEPVNWLVYNAAGGMVPTKEGPVSKKIIGGGNRGVIGLVDRLGDKSARKVKTEGPTDLLALLSADLGTSDCVFTNAFGAEEDPNQMPWLIKLVEGSICVTTGDQDNAGHKGIERWSTALATSALESRAVKLPFEMKESHGADLRDFFSLGGSMEAWERLISESETVFPPTLKIHNPRSGVPDTRVQIMVTDNEALLVQDVIEALGKEEMLFVRSDKLIEVYDAPNPADPDKHTTIAMRQVPEQKLRTIISGCCGFNRESGDEIEVCRIPGHLSGQVYHHAVYEGIRSLVGVSEWPFIRPDGSVCIETGYDAATQTIVRSSVPIPPVSDNPTVEECWDACNLLLSIVSDFEFAEFKHKAAWLASVLTVAARPAIHGPTPLFLVDASIWGSGKSKLAKLVGIIYSGRTMPETPWPSKDEEVEKKITSYIAEGRPWILWDNCKTIISGQALEASLTSEIYSARKLGKTEGLLFPNNTIQFATGNNATVSDDVARRTCHIRLVSESENPDSRTNFKHADLDGYVRANRGRFIHAALTILRGWHVAKQNGERVNVEAWGSYEAWSKIVRDALVWLGLPDVRSTSTDLKQNTAGDDSLRDLIMAFEAAEVEMYKEMTSREIFELANETTASGSLRNSFLNSVLKEIVGERKSFNAKEVGKSLKKFDGRIHSKKKICSQYDKKKKINHWILVPDDYRAPPN